MKARRRKELGLPGEPRERIAIGEAWVEAWLACDRGIQTQ